MSTRKRLAFLAGTVALSTLAAWYRWPDSAHALGAIRRGGGAARHPVALAGGRDEYVVVATATVIPPWRGDARISIEGAPAMEWDVEVSRPVVDLRLRRWPRLEGDTLRGLSPRDRVALWLRLRPPRADPVCGMACPEGGPRARGGGREECFCGETCRARFVHAPDRFPSRPVARGRWTVALRDAASGQPVLTIPFVLGGGEAADAGAHH
jgi:YHS domain-containing protein